MVVEAMAERIQEVLPHVHKERILEPMAVLGILSAGDEEGAQLPLRILLPSLQAIMTQDQVHGWMGG